MTASSDIASGGYRIGKVSRLTGISPDTLRVWERRYKTVVPQRTANGGRIYSSEDIARLTLMKKLVDAGDAIGSIANLTQAELESRLIESSRTSALIDHGGPLNIVVVGDALPARLRSAEAGLDGIKLVAEYSSLDEFDREKAPLDVDVIVIEQSSLQAETAIKIADWIARHKAVHAVVVYRFASENTLMRLPQGATLAIRAPVEPRTLQQYCVALTSRAQEHASDDIVVATTMSPAPARRYDDNTLARLAGMSPAIQCECPKHLAELIASLAAFEQYSGECESRNTADAELHAYLNNSASHARHVIENALAKVIEAENLEL